MSPGEAPGLQPKGQPPKTRAPSGWKHLITTLYVTIPDGVKRSAQARNRMLRQR